MNTMHYTDFGGRALLISASVPTQKMSEKYPRIQHARREIEEAIICVARATFSEGGRIVYGGSPAISLLISMVAAEYLPPRFAEGSEERHAAPIMLYQSMELRDKYPEMDLLDRLGYITMNWVGFEGGTLSRMETLRRRMIENSSPAAMICIGGMDDVQSEVALFQEMRQGTPVYVMATTGGMAEMFTRDESSRVYATDQKIWHHIQSIGREMRSEHETEEEREFRYIPYALIMQSIISDLASPESHL